jgi:hypothetical protein
MMITKTPRTPTRIYLYLSFIVICLVGFIGVATTSSLRSMNREAKKAANTTSDRRPNVEPFYQKDSPRSGGQDQVPAITFGTAYHNDTATRLRDVVQRSIKAPEAKTASGSDSDGIFALGITDTENPADDVEGALEFEFNMTKDPATGKIPEGIFEAERAQANETVKRRRSLNIPEVFSYNFVGPDNLGGRTRTIAYDVRYNGTSNRIILAGGVSGGVYKSIDDGATWVRKSPTGEHFSCTSIAQDPRVGFQDTWYYTVGEAIGNSANATGASYRGNGVYKTVDNGETWARLPTSNTGVLESFDNMADYIFKVVVDPTNGNVYIACVATIERSTDGGSTWGTVLSGTFSSSGQTTDIVVTSTGRFYAGFAGTNSVGADGVWTSTTGALATWTRIAGPGGTPTGWSANLTYGRVVLAVAPSHEAIVYVLYWNGTTYTCGAPAPEAKFFKLDMTVPATPAWTDRSANMPDESGCLAGNDPFAVQTGYDLVVAVKPDAEDTVFIGGTNSYRSTNGFATTALTTRIGGYASPASYALYASSHPDVHSFAFQPTSSTTMLCGNDGGIQRTTDDLAATVAWTQINSGYKTYQYYYVANDPRSLNSKVIGGAQDNGTTRNIGGSGSAFESVFGGDGVSVGLSNPAASGGVQYEYVGSQNGNISRRDATLGSGFGTSIRPTAASGNGLFVTLFKLDPDNTQTLYYANGSGLYLTTSASTVTTGTWTSLTGIATAVGANSITAIGLSRGAYSAATSSLFVGTNNGKVFRLDNPTGVPAATAPVDITGAGFPAATYVSSISTNPTNDDTVLVTFSNYAVTSVFWTGNANVAVPTWTAVEGTLTLPSYRSSAIVDTGAGGLQYFVGTSAGLYNTGGLPGSPAWTQEGSAQMGNSVVSSLDLRPSDNKLLVGTHGYGMWYSFLGGQPTAADGNIGGTINDAVGAPVSGVIVTLSGTESRAAITDSNGHYGFNNVETNGFYSVTPSLVNYHFSPDSRSFSLVGNKTDATFTAAPDATIVANAIDTSEYFVRQHYLDFLGREPEAGGFNYWSEQVNSCNGDADCVRTRRIDVSAAFFMSQEFKDTGSFVYRLYKGALGRQLRYSEFAADRAQVVGGPNIEASKTAFADTFVQRAEFADKYQGQTTAEGFVDALLQTMNDSAGVNLSGERAALISRYHEGGSMNASRALVVRQLVDNDSFSSAVYNQSFVTMQYFGYLRRTPEVEGYNFWLNVMNNDPANYRGMVCSFITSAEYQRRFSSVVSHSNAECGQ